jgi:hypothetical protein
MEFLSARSRRAFPEQHPIRAQRLPPASRILQVLEKLHEYAGNTNVTKITAARSDLAAI